MSLSITPSSPTQSDRNPQQPRASTTPPRSSISSLPNSEYLVNFPPPKHPMSYRPPSDNAQAAQAAQSTTPGPAPQVNLNTRPSSASSWAATVAATKGPLPSVIFAIPFPEPGPGLRKTSKTPLCMIYSLPRANYIKPKAIDGKKGKEGLIKTVERKWQEEVQESRDIKSGKLENPSGWKKFKGNILRGASKVLASIPDNNILTVSRLPPGKKIGLITVVYPHEDDEYTSNPIDRQPEDVGQGVEDILARSRRKAMLKSGLSGLFLPVTAAIDFFCVVPLFIFEINIVYFCLQINGSRKIATLFKAKSKAKKRHSKRVEGPKSGKFSGMRKRFSKKKSQDPEAEPLPASPPLPDELDAGEIFNIQKSRPKVFQPVMAYLYSLCCAADPYAFPRQHDGSFVSPFRPGAPMVTDLIDSFKEWVPADVALRHNLDPEFVAKDLRHSMQKATRAYMRSLKKIK